MENQVELLDYRCDGNNFEGTLRFTLVDHFGLDDNDVTKFGIVSGFKSWYILQHNEDYGHKYKPFKTVVVIYKDFSGTIRGDSSENTAGDI